MAREGDSFDPRTWASAGSGANRVAAPPAPAKPKPASKPAAPARAPIAVAAPATPVRNTSVTLAFGASALLLMLGGGAAFHFRTPATAATIAAAAASSAGVRLDLNLDSPAAISSTLTGAGTTTEVAEGAAGEATAVLGADAGAVHLIADLGGPDGAHTLDRLEATREDGSGVVLTVQPDGSYRSEARAPGGQIDATRL